MISLCNIFQFIFHEVNADSRVRAAGGASAVPINELCNAHLFQWKVFPCWVRCTMDGTIVQPLQYGGICSENNQEDVNGKEKEKESQVDSLLEEIQILYEERCKTHRKRMDDQMKVMAEEDEWEEAYKKKRMKAEVRHEAVAEMHVDVTKKADAEGSSPSQPSIASNLKLADACVSECDGRPGGSNA